MRILLVLLLCLGCLAQAPSSEARRIEQTLERMQSLKERLAEVQRELDELMRTLSEQKGALAVQPPAFGAPQSAAFVDSPDKAKPVVRCAALTKDGSRCTRAAVDGARYCKQHALARQK